MKKLLWTLPVIALTVAGCSSTTSDAAAADDSLTIVTSTQVWADIASAVAPDITVAPIVTDGDSDPHSFEPSAADMARVSEADIIVVGGGGYDSWLYDSLPEDDSRIIHALDLSEHDHEGDEADTDEHAGHDHADVDNEHVWYSTEHVASVAQDLADKIVKLDPEAQVTPEVVTEKMNELHNSIHNIPAVSYAQTETIADHLLSHSELVDATPAGYRASTLSHGEPTAADIAEFQDAIRNGDIDILINNPQSAAAVSTSLVELAEENNVPVVEIYESPQSDENFLDVFTQAVDDLTAAANQV
ncbi:hypothetical protein CDES_11955 [Corynebacterium deserti GIMN1.010]|uniref:ABC transporter substrate-binding protein n=2 Tax=Corynebacterium TaxID=1716 RepID=A0A0M3QA60_9CORY|nr:hypothetical protein CDES_11955 [Corynebacterium deserti GIMN1.010]